jgi:hypothetical protein
MDEIGSDGILRHEIPVHPVLRLVLMAVGLFVVAISMRELHRGVWPLNITSPLFVLIIVGAFAVGVPAFLAGLTGYAMAWRVAPGRIDIDRRNPFRARRDSFTPYEIAGFAVRERTSSEGDSTWVVAMTTTGGARYETRDFGSEQTAQRFRERIETVFRG